MENFIAKVAAIFKRRGIQMFICFLVPLLVLGVIIYPLVRESRLSTVLKSTTEAEMTAAKETLEIQNAIEQMVTITANQASIYTTAQNQGESIATLAQYDKLLLLHDVGNGWMQVQYDGRVAWIESKDVEVNRIVSGITDANLNIYLQATTSSAIVTTPTAGELLQVIEDTKGEFTHVEYRGKRGYILTESITYNVTEIKNLLLEQKKLPLKENTKKILLTKLEQTPVVAETDATSTVVERLSSGTELLFEERVDDYYSVVLPSGAKGYIPYWLVLTNFAAPESDSTIPKSLAQAVIVIDPGHGGEDPGAVVDFHPTTEAQLTLSTAKKLKSVLEAVGATVIMTRSDDTYIALLDRANVSNTANADIFISLHYDSTEVSSMTGTTTYYYNLNDRSLAEVMSKHLKMDLKLTQIGAMFGDYAVIRENRQPALLLELGYLNNRADNAIITTDAYQEDVATAIVEALLEYYQ